MSATSNYMTDQMEQQQEVARSTDYAQLTQQSAVDNQYFIQILLSECSDQGNQSALIKHDDNVYFFDNFSQKSQNPTTESVPVSLTVKEMVQKIKSVFGLNNVQIAGIIGVSRPSLYNHIAGKETPVSLDSYKALYDIAVQVENKTKGPLKPGLKSILVNGKTLLAYLKERNVEPEKIVYAAQEVSKRLSGNTGKTTIPISKQRETSRRLTKSG